MVKYFLGSSCPNGFFSLFSELTSKERGYIFILKGGPGTGKSTMMKNIAATAEKSGIACERICCSSDNYSLDGIILPSLNICVADGTSPHTLDPRYPGVAGEIINLGDCWRAGELMENREEIIRLTDANAACHARCKRFLETAFSLNSCAVRLLETSVDNERLSRYASRCAKRLFPLPNGKIGVESKRLLDAVTPEGYVFLSETVQELCSQTVVFEEDYASASLILINELRRYAVGNGLDVITSPCISGNSGTRHLIIPSLSLGFFTSDCMCKADIKDAKRVSMRRFYEPDTFSRNRVRLGFSKKACGEMLGEAVAALQEAKRIHDELEKIYIGAMDYCVLDGIEKTLTARIIPTE